MSYIFHMKPDPDGYYGYVFPLLDERRLEAEVDNWIANTEVTANKIDKVRFTIDGGGSHVELPAYKLDEKSAVLFQIMYGEYFEQGEDKQARTHKVLGAFRTTVYPVVPVIVR